MLRVIKKNLSLFCLFGLLTACGGGSSSSNAPSVGTFTDAGLVSGLQYQTATQSGITDANGKFNYLPGETITFKIGNIILGQATASPTLNTFDLVGITPPLSSLGLTTNTTSGALFQKAINISVLLQTLDNDGNSTNGISIPTKVIELAANTTLNFSQKYYDFYISFPLRQFVALCRAAGLWSGSRGIVLPGYAANQLYSGLNLSPSLFETSSMENFDSSGSVINVSESTYDAYGNISESRYFNSSRVLQDRYTSSYDLNGNLIESKEFNGSNVLQSRYTSTYDSNGNLIESKEFNGSNVLQSRYTSTYDSNGNRLESKFYDGSDVLQTRYTLAYDLNGNLIESKEFNGSNVLQSRYTSTYDSNGNRLETKFFNGSNVLQSRYTSTYDSNGNRLETKFFNGSNVLQSRYTLAYDSNGNLIESKSYDGSDVLQTRYTLAYDSNGNRLETKFFNGSNVLQSRYISTYDSNGNLIESKSYDGSDNLQQRYVYTLTPVSGWSGILVVDEDGPG